MSGSLQKIVLTVVGGVLTLAISGLWVSVNELLVSSAVTQSQIKDLRAAVLGVYTQHDAEKDFAAVHRVNEAQDNRLDDLGQRVRTIEMGPRS